MRNNSTSTSAGRHEPRSSASCAACKLLKRRCSSTCIFAPYFNSNDTNKFAKVHRVFGASNVSKILTQVPENQREETVNSLIYEAEARLEDPVYGCIGAIASLQRKLDELQRDLSIARARLAAAAAGSVDMQSDQLMSFDDDDDVKDGCVYGDGFGLNCYVEFDQIIAAYNGCDASLAFQ